MRALPPPDDARLSRGPPPHTAPPPWQSPTPASAAQATRTPLAPARTLSHAEQFATRASLCAGYCAGHGDVSLLGTYGRLGFNLLCMQLGLKMSGCAPARFELAASCSRAPSLLTRRL